MVSQNTWSGEQDTQPSDRNRQALLPNFLHSAKLKAIRLGKKPLFRLNCFLREQLSGFSSLLCSRITMALHPRAAADTQTHLMLRFLFAGSTSDQALEVSALVLGASRASSASQHAQPPSSRGLMPGKRLASQMPGSSWESQMPGRSFCRKMLVSGSKGKCRMPERC